MSSDRRWPLVVVLLVLVVCAGIAPYAETLHHIPHGPDAQRWVTESHPDHPGWLAWVFTSRHFIGYRPVTALSFTLDGWLFGWNVWGYRATDLLFHALTAIGIYFLYRKITGDRSWWGSVAPLLYLAHPAAENVVPHLARRSYLIAAGASTWAAVIWLHALDRRSWLAGLVALGLLALGLGSNEIAFATALMIPIFTWVRLGWDHKRWVVASSVPIALLVGLALAARYMVLGRLGGYHKRYFAFVDDGVLKLKLVDDEAWLQIADAAWSYLLFPTSNAGRPAWLDSMPLAEGLGAVVVIWLAWSTLTHLSAAHEPFSRGIVSLVAWLLGLTALFAWSGNWFWRMGHPMLVPFSVLWAALLYDAFTRRRWPDKALTAAGAILVLLSATNRSPILDGVERGSLRGRFHTTGIIQDVIEQIEPLPEAAAVWLALPMRRDNAINAAYWIRRRFRERQLSVRLVAVNQEGGAARRKTHSLLIIDRVDGRERLTLGDGREWGLAARRLQRDDDPRTMWFDRLDAAPRDTWLILPAPEKMQSLPVPRRPRQTP